jgi:hypothetical protein
MSEKRLNRTNPKSEPPSERSVKRPLDCLKSKRRLPSQFGKIENVKNFDVEKMVLLKIVFYRKL